MRNCWLSAPRAAPKTHVEELGGRGELSPLPARTIREPGHTQAMRLHQPRFHQQSAGPPVPPRKRAPRSFPQAEAKGLSLERSVWPRR